MLDEQLKTRGKAIVSELELGRDQTTEKWMAHYLAELMERAEKAETPELREQAASQSANIILTLWEQKKKKSRHEYYSALNGAFSDVYEKRPFAEALKSVLDAPDQVDEITEISDQISVLFFLDYYEMDLLRLYLIAQVVSNMEANEMNEEILKEFEEAEGVFISTKRHLQDIWPEVEQLSLTQIKHLETFITGALRTLYQIRARLLVKMGAI